MLPEPVSVSLAGLPPFASLAPDAVAALEPLFERRVYGRDGVLFHEDDAPDWLYFLLSGHVKMMKHADDGRVVILHLAMPGDLLGGVSAYGRRPHPFTAQAMAPVEALRVAGPEFAAIMDRYPTVARWTLDDLVDQLTEAHETMKSLAVERVERRIARQLVKLARRAGEPTAKGLRIVVPLARQDVADMAGTSVETAIRVLSRWRQLGLVCDEAGHLVLTDLAGLAEVADDGA